jgi:hypothetical protein
MEIENSGNWDPFSFVLFFVWRDSIFSAGIWES